jgi:hypothetical protein
MEDCVISFSACKNGLFVMNKIFAMHVKQCPVHLFYVPSCKKKVVAYNILLWSKYRKYLFGLS